MVKLYEHNQKTYENICRMYNEGIQRVAIVQPTGSGKSLLMAKLIEENPDSRFFILSSYHKINDQFKEKLDEETLARIDFNIYYNMPGMKKETMESLKPDYIFLDEMHRALAKEWNKGIKVLLEMYPDAKVLGLSATPIRYLDKRRNVVNELFNNNMACDMGLSQAILEGILPMARYVCGVYSYDKDTESLNAKIEKSYNSEEEKKELLKQVKILKENLDKGQGVSDIFRKYLVSGNEKLVVFLKDTTHLRAMKPVIEKWFLDAGFSVRLYEIHCKNADSDKEFLAFKEDTMDGVKLCLSVNMIAEGIHGDIDGVIMLRETISPNYYFQMIGRAFACGKKTIPLIFDLVANSQFISDAIDISFPNELKREIKKRKEECEKEGKAYEVGFDVDEFVIMDQFMDVVSGFRVIEERLQGDWDVMFQEYCKFYEENGHGDVPKTDEYMKLYNWCKYQRRGFVNKILKDENRKRLLDEKCFIWDVNKYRFEKNIIDLRNYYNKYGKCPSTIDDDFKVRKLGCFVCKEIKLECNEQYPTWKKAIVQKYFSQISDISINEIKFNEFIYYAELYKKKYGHIDIKSKDVIDGYTIGRHMGNLRKKFIDNELSEEKVKRLKLLGVYLGNKSQMLNQILFDKNMELVRLAVDNGVIINKKNQIFHEKNLYYWIKRTVRDKYIKCELPDEQIEIIEKLIGKPLYKINNGDFINITDITNNRKIAICKSQHEAASILQNLLSEKVNVNVIYSRLAGKVTTPYKGRFMFYYATDEEIKSYLENEKVS